VQTVSGANLPDSVLLGNGAGFPAGVIDLSVLPAALYGALRVSVTLSGSQRLQEVRVTPR